MNYQLTDLNFEISISDKIILNKEYQEFYSKNVKQPNCILNIKKTGFIKNIDVRPVFYEEQRFCVCVDKLKESRLFFDYSSGKPYALLEDYGKKKELLLLSSEKERIWGWSEKKLLNCFALEKTLSEFGRIILHASFIETEQGAVLFSAPSGTGKSTQAALWNQYRGAEIVNGDRAGIWKSENQWMAGGVPWCGTSGITKNKKMPLRAIVILEQGTENKISVLPTIKMFRHLLEQTTINPWNHEMFMRSQNILLELCKEVPVLYFSCRPDQEAVEVLARELGL